MIIDHGSIQSCLAFFIYCPFLSYGTVVYISGLRQTDVAWKNLRLELLKKQGFDRDTAWLLRMVVVVLHCMTCLFTMLILFAFAKMERCGRMGCLNKSSPHAGIGSSHLLEIGASTCLQKSVGDTLLLFLFQSHDVLRAKRCSEMQHQKYSWLWMLQNDVDSYKYFQLTVVPDQTNRGLIIWEAWALVMCIDLSHQASFLCGWLGTSEPSSWITVDMHSYNHIALYASTTYTQTHIYMQM